MLHRLPIFVGFAFLVAAFWTPLSVGAFVVGLGLLIVGLVVLIGCQNVDDLKGDRYQNDTGSST